VAAQSRENLLFAIVTAMSAVTGMALIILDIVQHG
jgi:hypothetical protein